MENVRVLFLAANPVASDPLKLDQEIRAITDKIRASEQRDQLTLVSAWAVRPDDLLQALNEHKPRIVHFSAHGSPAGELILVGSDGNPKPVGAAAIRALFRTLKGNIRLVVLNACYSRTQAEATVEVIDCAIGMNAAIGDEAATVFAASFYRAIGFGCSVQAAFDQGQVALMLEGIPEDTTPELLCRTGVDPSQVFLLPTRERHFSWRHERVVQDDETWIDEGLDWLRTDFYSQYGSDRVRDYGVSGFSEWEQHASTLEISSLLEKGRTLIEQREYPKATAYWAELCRREPKNSEYESYLRLSLSKVERDIRVQNAIGALLSMAHSALHLGLWDEAILYVRRSLILSPNHADALRLLQTAQRAKQEALERQRASQEEEE